MSAMPERVRPYEGKEDYIFVSYSHRDSERIFPLLRTLSSEGYRLWYDEGIDPGTEWPESIASHLAACKVCLAFISPTSVTSTNCRREINFALSRNKDFLSVVLEPVEMSPGMEMQISTYQSLMSYKYPSRKDFEEKLLSVEILQSCREQRQYPASIPAEPVSRSTEIPSAAVPHAADDAVVSYPVIQQEVPVYNVPQAPVQSDPLPAARPSADAAKGAVRTKPKKESPKRKRSPLLFIVPAAAVVVILAVLLILNPFGKKLVINGEKITNDNSITIRNASVTAEHTKMLSSFDKCRYLYFYNCSFGSGATENLSAMPQMTTLKMENCTEIEDLSFLNSMQSMTELSLKDCSLPDQMFSGIGLSPKIKTLNLDGNALAHIPVRPEMTDLSVLTLKNNRITDLSPLSGLEKITKLDLTGNLVSSLDGIESSIKLKELYLSGNHVSDISLLEPFVYLEKLDFSGNDIQSADPLSNCSILSYVNLNGCGSLHCLPFLEKNTETLTYLDISGIRGVDSSVLSACRNLKMLNIVSCAFEDISFVSSMTDLQVINAADNSVSDLKPLKNCGSLNVANFAGNCITSAAGLPDAKVEEGKNGPAFSLLLHDNRLTDLSGIDPNYNYKILTIFGNPVTDVSALNGVKGYRLLTEMTEELDPENLKGFIKVYVPEAVTELRLPWEKALNTKLSYTDTPEALVESLTYANVLNSVVLEVP